MLSYLHSLESHFIDFILAFLQAVLESEVYMEISQGFKRLYNGEYCILKLKRSIYGLNRAITTSAKNYL